MSPDYAHIPRPEGVALHDSLHPFGILLSRVARSPVGLKVQPGMEPQTPAIPRTFDTCQHLRVMILARKAMVSEWITHPPLGA